MIKYIKVNGKRIIEVRPLLPADYPVDASLPEDEIEYIVNPELEARFDKEFIKVDIPIGLDDIELLQGYYFHDGKLVKTNEIKDRQKLSDEMKEIQIWLELNDWVPNKIVTGEWDPADARWLDYLKQRKAKRERFDQLKEILGG